MCGYLAQQNFAMPFTHKFSGREAEVNEGRDKSWRSVRERREILCCAEFQAFLILMKLCHVHYGDMKYSRIKVTQRLELCLFSLQRRLVSCINLFKI